MVEAVAAAIDTVHGRVDAGREKKMLRNGYAIGMGAGLGLILVHSNSASAHQQDIRQHYAPPAVHHHRANHRPVSAKKDLAKKDLAKKDSAKKDIEKDSKALTSLKKEIRDLRKQVDEVEALRHELTDLKEKIWGPTPLPLTLSVLTRPQSSAVLEPKQVTLKLPDFSEPYRPPAPVNPATASLPVAIDERSAERAKPKSTVEEAKAFLIDTATPGYTMVRQGVPVAIGRLHPDFIVKLAAAIKLAREAGMTGAGVFSAYRPPAFGIGGFSDKFNSLHSYGLAADMTGIGGPGSRFAKLWQAIVRRVGLYLPYGANNRAEFNHTQLVPTKMASSFLRRTITASEPKNLQQMWLASGVNAYVVDVTTKPTLASATPEQRVRLPAIADKQTTSQQSPEPTRAPRRSRVRRPGKRGAARIRVSARSSARKKGKSRRRAAKT